ncbi:SGNH/GDSL hydrolase family protein [Rhodotorula paludigena]|uniref:SGNH/GDSL hydrolase family protein n=1 Tax=Rhodotorula paludigena TaxID=86838 RepID=UPI003175B8D9
MGGIELFSPPSSPALGRHSLTSTRWRPSLLTTACCLANLFVFVLYHHHFTSSQPTQPQDVQLEVLRDDVPTANSSAAVTPPSRALSCEVCHLDPSNPLCEYGYSAIRQSRAYEGSGTRLRRVLQKALRGEAIQVGVLGASVTQGHGVIPPYQRWEDRWFEEFQHIFPSAVMHVGAVPAAGSQFFSYCFGSVVSSDLDLYLVELDINNDVSFDTMQEDDSLMRGLLGLPQQPAVIRLSVFALLFEELARGSTSSLSTSQFFDVPVISIRNFLLPYVIKHREAAEELFSLTSWGERDYRHISGLGHQAAADMLSLFVRKEICEAQRHETLPPPPPRTGPWPVDEDLESIPELALSSSWIHPKPILPLNPICQSTMTPLTLMVPLSHSPTFEFETWNDKSAWSSSTPGAQIRFRFVGSRVSIFVWATNGRGELEQSPEKAIRRREAPGSALCWIEDEEMGAEEWLAKYGEDGDEADSAETDYWEVNSHVPTYVASTSDFVELTSGLEPRSHILACEVSSNTTSGGHRWRIQGIASQ